MRKWDKWMQRVNIMSKEKQVSWNLHNLSFQWLERKKCSRLFVFWIWIKTSIRCATLEKALEDCSSAIENKILTVCFHLAAHPAYCTICQWVLKSQGSFEQFWRLYDWSLPLPLSPPSAELQEMIPVLFFSNTWMPSAISPTTRASHHRETDWDQLAAIWVLHLQQRWPLQRNLQQPNMLISFAAFRRIIAIEVCSH